MENNLTSIVHQWLSKADIRISKSYLNHKLSSHPSYPSMLSITDTLDELGIENAALVVDKEKLSEIPVPFLINANGKGTSFFLINNTQKLLTEKSEFLKQWDGIVIVMEKPPSFSDTENNSWLSKERFTRKSFSATILLLLLLSIAAVSFEFDWLVAVLLLLIVAGITISTLVVQHELGIANDFTKQLCTAGKIPTAMPYSNPGIPVYSDGLTFPTWELSGIVRSFSLSHLRFSLPQQARLSLLSLY